MVFESVEKRERRENGSMKVPDMGERLCFLFWADMHYFAAMRQHLFGFKGATGGFCFLQSGIQWKKKL
ncbi:hypothetical protein IMY05_018G0090100 [Salix suchowensis]|nr:hypothetical protein IMY05_018G0090100 [Salix suchowensis]